MTVRRYGQPAGGEAGFAGLGGVGTAFAPGMSMPTRPPSFLAPVSTGGGAEPAADFSQFGKINVNLLDVPTPQLPSPTGAPQPLPVEPNAAVPFHGVPILGNIMDFTAGILGSEAIGKISPIGQVQSAMGANTWEQGANDPARAEFAKNVAEQSMLTQLGLEANKPGTISLGNAQAQYLRYVNTVEHPEHALMADVGAPGVVGLGATFMSMMSILGLAQRGVQRTVGGFDGRIDSFLSVSDAELSANADPVTAKELIDLRNEISSGKMSHDEGLDQLIIHGFGMANPFGNSPGGFAASMITQLGSDPLTVLPLATGSLSVITKLSTKAAIGAITKEAGAELTASFAKKIGETAVETGLKPTQQAVLTAMIADPEMLPIVEKAMVKLPKITQFLVLDAPRVIRVGNKINDMLNPLSLFGHGDAAALVGKDFANRAADGWVLGHGVGPMRRAFADMSSVLGKDAAGLIDGHAALAAGNRALQVGNELSILQAIKSGSLALLDDPTAAAGDMARRMGRGIGNAMQDTTDRVRIRVVPTTKGGLAAAFTRARGVAVQQIVDMAPSADRVAVEKMVAKWGERELGIVDDAHYGWAGGSYLAAKNAAIAAVRDGVEAAAKYDPDQITFVAPRQLTKQGMAELEKALAKGSMAKVRSIIAAHDELFQALPADLTDAELKALLRSKHLGQTVLEQIRAHLPSAIEEEGALNGPLQEWLDQMGPLGYKLALRPADGELARAIYDEAGILRGVQPWIDFTNEAMAKGTISRFRVVRSAILGGVSGRTVLRDAEHRFIQIGANKTGIPEDALRSIFRVVASEAQRQKLTGVRGLESEDMWTAAMSLTKTELPAVLRGKMTQRELASAMLQAHEGSLSVVGMTQKLSGIAKSAVFEATGSNSLGILAEKFYPMLKFSKNVAFITQEIIETPLLMLARGQMPISDFRNVWTKTGREIITREVDEALWAMAATMRKGTKTHLDMVEYNGLQMGGERAVTESVGRWKVLDKIPISRYGNKMHDIKNWGEARSWQFNEAAKLQRAIEHASPRGWHDWAAWQNVRNGYANDRNAISGFMLDAVAKTDPDSVYNKFGHAAFRPEWIGSRSRVSNRFVRWAVTGDDPLARESEVVHQAEWQKLVGRVRDPNDSLSAADIHARLLAMGASPDYAERAVLSTTMPSADEYWATWRDLGRSDAEIAAERATLRAQARNLQMSERELIIQRHPSAPMAIDELGNYRGPTQFQHVVDAFDSAGVHTVAADDVAHWDAVREHANAKMPVGWADTAPGVPVKDLTDVQAKARKWSGAYERAAADPTVGTSRATIYEIGPNGERMVAPDMEQILTADGKLSYRVGEPTFAEAEEMLSTHLPSRDVFNEKAAWYHHMRTGLSALNGNDPRAAAEHILALVTTQTNASPAQGMRLLLRASAIMTRGGDPLTELNAVSSLEQLARALTAEGTLESKGLAQKLLDFSDSLLGNERRTAGFHGPDPARPWGPWAQDVWMQRFMGHVDEKMSGHLKQALGADRVVLGPDGYTISKGGRTFLIPRDAITDGVPSADQYAHAVQWGNEFTDHLNRVNYQGRGDWQPHEIQAAAWASTKKSLSSDNGDVIDAIMAHRYSAAYDLHPTNGARLSEVYPDNLAPRTQAKIDTATMRHADGEASDLIGTHALPPRELPDGLTGQVMGGEQDAQAHAVVVAYMQQHESAAVFSAKDEANPAFEIMNDWGVNPGGEAFIDWLRGHGYGNAADALALPDSAITRRHRVFTEGVYQRHAPRETAYFRAEQHADTPGWAGRADALTGADIQRAYDAPDGSGVALGQRLNRELGVAGGGTVDSGGAVLPGARATHAVSAAGDRRGRFVAPGEFQALHAEGQAILDRLAVAPRTAIVADLDPLVADAQKAVLAPWGGATFDAHTGQLMKSDAMYHGTMAQFSPSIEATGISRGHFINDVKTARSYTPPGAQFRVYRASRSKLQGGRELSPGWMENSRVRPADLEVLRSDAGQFEPVVPGSTVGSGPFTSAYGSTTSIPATEAADPVRFRAAFDQFVADNQDELEKAGRQIGVFHDADLHTVEFNVNVTVATEREAEALQLAAGRTGGAYDHWTMNGVFAPVPRHADQLFQRSKKGILAATQMDGQRARVFVDPAGRRADTMLHERGHAVLENFDPSARLQIKRAFAEENALPRAMDDLDAHALESYLFISAPKRPTVHLERAFETAVPLPAPRTFYRGVDARERSILEDRVGREYVADGYTSVADREGAQGFARDRPLVRIEAPAGTRTLDMNVAKQHPAMMPMTRDNPGTAGEHLLPAGQTFDVTMDGEELVLTARPAPAPVPAPARPTRLAPDQIAPVPDSTLTEAEHEWFVKNYINYHRTGEPPSPELQGLFDHYGQALRRMKKEPVNPDVAKLLDEHAPTKSMSTFGHNYDEQQLMAQMIGVSGLASRNARDLIHFNTSRSWLERSLNHPFLGLYPLSYMWGKILPEFVQFLAFKPFGFQAPLAGFMNTLKAYQYMMLQQEHDPELRQYMKDNEPAFRSVAMLLPALPWDMPVNASYAARHIVQGVAGQVDAVQKGKLDKDGNPVQFDLTKIDWGKIAAGAAAYSFDPTKGPSLTAGYIQGLKALGDMGFNAVMGNNFDGSGKVPIPPAVTAPPAAPSSGNAVKDALTVTVKEAGDKLVQQLGSPTP